MTQFSAKDLRDYLNNFSDKDLDVPIYFDREEKSADYCMAKVGNAFMEHEPKKHLCLTEDS